MDEKPKAGRGLGAVTPWSVLALVLLLLAPLLFYRSMVFDGLEPAAADTQAHRPVAEWANGAAEELGETPQWFPFFFSGMPSYGSFLHIPRPVCNLLGQTMQLFSSNRGMRYVLLFALAGALAFGFFRRQGYSRLASVTAALLYSLTPYFVGAVGAGHSTKIEALALAPGVLWAVDYLLDRPGPLAAALLAAASATLAWANHPQIAYYAILIIGFYALIRALLMRGGPRRWGGWVVWGGLGLFLAGALVAEPYLAIREYTPYSIRGAGSAVAAANSGGGVGWVYATAWSFFPRELVSFLFPSWFGLEGQTYWGPLPFTQSTHYFGILAVGLAFLGLWKGADPRRWIWAGLCLFVLVVGFGRNVPVLYRPMFEFLPLFDRFRVPSMIYAFLPLCAGVPICAGIDSLSRLLAHPGKGGKGKKPSAARSVWILALVGTVVLWGVVFGLARGLHPDAASFLREQEAAGGAAALGALAEIRRAMQTESIHGAFVLLVLALALLAAASRPRLSGRARFVLIGAVMFLAVADVWRVGAQLYHPSPRPAATELVPLRGAAEYLSQQPGPFRVLPVEPYFSSNGFAVNQIETLGGYQPAKLRIYQDLVDAGVLFSNGVLAMLNAEYLVTSRQVEALDPPAYQGDGYVYRLPSAAGPAWSVRDVLQVTDPQVLLSRIGSRDFDPEAIAYVYDAEAAGSYEPALVTLEERELHRIRLRTSSSGAAFVVSSEIHYAPGWVAKVDGVEVPIHRVDHVLRGVKVPSGDHEIVFQSRAQAYARGRMVSRAAAGFWLLLLVIPLVGRQRARARNAAQRSRK